MSGAGARTHSQRGVALVLTLIMLAVITIVTVVFLATTRRNRQSVTVRKDQTTSEHAAEIAFQHVNARLIERILRETNLMAFDFLVSYPASSILVTNSGVVSHPPSYGYELDANRNVIRPLDPDTIPRVLNGSNTVDVYLDLNRNRRFDDPGGIDKPFGDPIWIGVLDRPWFPHSRTNRFIARFAYVVLPTGKSLDLNTIHNDTSPNPGYGYMRNQGVGPWELNLGAFLHELAPNYWEYDYSGTAPEAKRSAFADARSIVNYRHGWPDTPPNAPLPFDRRSFAETYIDAPLNFFPSPSVDIYSDGRNGVPLGRDISVQDDDYSPLKLTRWPGADTTNHFFHLQQLFDPATTRSNRVTIDFYTRLTNAMTTNFNADRTLYYKLLAQLATDPGSDVHDRINLNFADEHVGYSPTNFVPWDFSPALAVGFFTNVAERIFLAQSNELNVSTNFVVRSIMEIPVYPTNRYTTAIHRILQLAANIFDAANTNLYPAVFRPLFGPGPVAGVNYIVGYTNDNRVSTLKNWLDSNTNGIPLVVGAKKGYPNFNEFSMWSTFLVSRKLQVTRLATNAPPNGTNMMYTLGISNSFGVELWNSYIKAFPRDLTITISNFTVATLTNQYGYIFQTNEAANPIVMPVAAGSWKGIGLGLNDTNSFKVPAISTNAFLVNSMYRFLDPPNTFVPISTNNYEVVTVPEAFPVPSWYLTLSNRMTCTLSEGVGANSRIVDFVLLNDNLNVDLTRELLSGKDPFGVSIPTAIQGVWSTNRPVPNGPTDGIQQQIDISDGDSVYAVYSDWNAFSQTALKSDNDKDLAIRRFRDFLGLPPRVGDVAPAPSSLLKMQAPFNPAAKLAVVSVWQANDPLVHYHAEDLRFEAPTNHYFKPSQTVNDISPSSLGSMNTRYAPWGGRTLTGTPEPTDYDLTVKDPGVFSSDDWHFPSNKLATVGLLGRVHRGTPWQTVYFKPEIAPLSSWYHQSVDIVEPTDPKTGRPYIDPKNGQPYQVSRTHPTNDWKLADMFTTAIDERTSSGLVSINQTNMETWSALLSGVLVLSNSLKNPVKYGARNYDEWLIEPWGNQPLTNSAFARIWSEIYAYQTNHVDGEGRRLPLQSIGELIQNVPALTTKSPFISTNIPEQMQWGMDDFAYEQIPQQILSLLRLGQSRFVIYGYGQALKPERIDPATGRVENYQVTAEYATRTVVRIEGDPRSRVRTVVESFNILPPD